MPIVRVDEPVIAPVTESVEAIDDEAEEMKPPERVASPLIVVAPTASVPKVLLPLTNSEVTLAVLIVELATVVVAKVVVAVN